MTQANFDEKLCTQCEGRCCQGHPGVWNEPQRFFSLFPPNESPTAISIRRMLEDKRLTLRNLDGILIPAPQKTDQGCGFLRTEGCALPVSQRPCQCLALIPDLETLLDDRIHCRLPPACGSGTARENWLPFQALLRQV